MSSAILELTGLALVVIDVRDARRAARRALQPYSPGVPMTFPVTATFRTSFEALCTTPPLEARVAKLEHQLNGMRRDLSDRLDSVRDELREEAFSRMALAEAEKREHAVREFMADQLDSGIGRRIAGTCLFVAGVLLSVPANLM